MKEQIISKISDSLKISEKQTNTVLEMLSNGDTVPFIARYRKEQTGALDEEKILYIEKQYQYQTNLEERKLAVIDLIQTQGKLTDELRNEILKCEKLSQVEDLYKPYKQKKKTRAAVAIKKGLQPLADYILSLPIDGDINKEANKYINEEVTSIEDAIQGAKDIIAEVISDDAKLRWLFKDIIYNNATLITTKKKDAVDERLVYQMYYEYQEKVSSIANHRIMAIDRGENEKVLTVTFEYNHLSLSDKAIEIYQKGIKTIVQDILTSAIIDGMERLFLPSIENEIRSDLSTRAHNSSIDVFSLNLEKLLSQPPIKGRIVLGFDPGFYNGCKLAIVDETGKMLTVDKIYPFRKDGEIEKSKEKLLALINKYDVKIIAIGNGTASRESEKLVSEVIKDNKLDTTYAIVSEAGASVWSAQKEAKEEFPDMAIEERSAVSIARRLLDPLSELIKIDPKSIGVGQYQHDLPEKQLSERLDEATMMVVNRVGADLNTASVALLQHISGLNKGIATEIVEYRNKNGKFTNRQQLLNVKKLKDKVFKQCAGFLRISDGDEMLDSTSIHPESYDYARKIMQVSHIENLGDTNIVFNNEEINKLKIDSYTLKDIKDSIVSPLKDYRDQFDGAILKSDILELKDLSIGQELQGTVRNVVDFGAFIDIGLHDDGLVHISRMAPRRIKHPSEVVSVNDVVKVYVFDIDTIKNRVQLSLLPLNELNQTKKPSH